MKHVRIKCVSSNAEREYKLQAEDEISRGVVHYEGVPLIGSTTLCGETDPVGLTYVTTNKPVTCKGCLAVRDHVKGK